MIRFPKKVVLGYGFDLHNFPVKMKNDKINELAWKNIIKTNTLDEAYKLVIQGWIQ